MRWWMLSLVLTVACRGKVEPGTDTGSVNSGTVDADGDGYDSDEDCDDENDLISPSAAEICDSIDNNCDGNIDEGVTSTFYADEDADGFGDPDATADACEAPSGFVSVPNDCDDTDNGTYPGAPERCDGADNDCDGEVDEDVLTEWYADADGDGFGDPGSFIEDCDPPSGYVSDDTDCDDLSAAANPDAVEVCDEADNDCDGSVDEDVTTTFYQDADADGFGVADVTTEACVTPGGYAADSGDCDDADAEISPEADEVCDGADNDCDGTTDEDDATDAATWYADADGDRYGDAGTSTAACDQPAGYVSDDTDCDDAEASANPGEAEVCDEIDNDCDGDTDEDSATDASTWYADSDGDGYGSTSSTTACAQPSGFADNSDDCDDAEASANPGEAEVCDEIDNDCDGDTDEDVTTTYFLDYDSDGYGDSARSTEACSEPSGYVSDDTDCDDSESAANPGESEVCDEIDNDCDGDTDEGVTTTYYADIDGDGYGDAAATADACSAPSGYVSDDTDCDDAEADANPGEAEVCDEIDNDCDGGTDEGVTTTYYADGDGDGFGDPDDTTDACSAPSGYLDDSSDCDDAAAAVYPGASEVCNSIDDDCDGAIDDDDSSLDTSTGETFYADADGDGYGDPGDSTEACAAPSGYLDDSSDCDDSDSAVSPEGTESCNGTDDDCSGEADDGAAVGASSSCAAESCLAVLDADSSATDGVYWIDLSGGAEQLRCDMTDDDGGWTLVANFVWPGSTAGVSGWISGSQVGSTLYDTSASFKLSDADINALVTERYRAWGEASYCIYGSCSVDITLYWSDSCTYASGASSSGACAVAYRDVDLADATGYTTPCTWHYGLTSVSCGGVSEMGTSHSGNHVFAGVEDSTNHAYDGRSSEDPSVMVWVR